MACFVGGAETVTLSKGSLPAILNELEARKPVELQLQGEASAIDLVSLKYLPASVEKLDMSNLTIKGGTLTEGSCNGQTDFVDGELPQFALFATGVREVTLPASLTVIGEGAFAQTPLTTVNFPASLTAIGPRAFYMCESLKSADLSATKVTAVAEQCFYGCASMTTLSLPTTASRVGNRALMKSGVRRLDLQYVRQAGDYAFAQMPALVEVTLRDGVTVGEGAFFGDGELGRMAGMPANSAALALANNKLGTVIGSVGGEVVEEGAYANIPADTLVIHPSVTEIKAQAFRNATKLKAVDVSERGSDIPVCDADAFAGVNVGNVALVVAPRTEEEWGAAPVWQNFKIERKTTQVEDMLQSSDITIAVSDKRIVAKAGAPISNFAVYSLGGVLLHQSQPDATETEAGPFEDETLVVRVEAGGVVKVTKIMR